MDLSIDGSNNLTGGVNRFLLHNFYKPKVCSEIRLQAHGCLSQQTWVALLDLSSEGVTTWPVGRSVVPFTAYGRPVTADIGGLVGPLHRWE